MNSAGTVRRLGVAVIVAAVCAGAVFIVWRVSSSSPGRPDIFLICIDTLRSDATGCSLPQESFTPEIDEVAKDGIVFEYALSQAANTHPSMAALFTSRLTFEFTLNKETKDYLAKHFYTWTEWLHDLGYSTHAFVTNPWCGRELGFGQGFDSFKMRMRRESADVTEAGISILDSTDGSPRFVWLHYWFPHTPYRRHEEFLPSAPLRYDGRYHESFDWPEAMKLRDPNLLLPQEELEYVKWMYNSEARRTDRAVGAFIEALRERDLYTDSLIVVCADHGEEFQEHRGMGHSHTVFEEVIHVPLTIKLPRNKLAGTRVKTRVRLIDVLPTLADVLEEDFPAEMLGKSLLPLAKGLGAMDDRTVISTAEHNHECIYIDNWKYVLSRAIPLPDGHVPIPKEQQDELFDMSTDRAERVNLASDWPEKLSFLRRTIDEVRKRRTSQLVPAKPEEVLDEETLKALRSLGYI